MNTTKPYPLSFSARVTNNIALRKLIRENKSRYGEAYIRKARNLIQKLGTPNDTITFKNPTWRYYSGVDGKLHKEGVTYALFNNRYVGYLENRFFANFISRATQRIKILDANTSTNYQKRLVLNKKPTEEPKPKNLFKDLINKLFKRKK